MDCTIHVAKTKAQLIFVFVFALCKKPFFSQRGSCYFYSLFVSVFCNLTHSFMLYLYRITNRNALNQEVIPIGFIEKLQLQMTKAVPSLLGAFMFS